MSKQEWKNIADSIFASFGDEINDATVVMTTGKGSYDSDTGAYVKTTTSITTKAVFTERNERVIDPGTTVTTNHKFVMVRGSDFSSTPHIGDTIQINSQTFKIEKVLPDDAETGAYYEMLISI